MNEIVTEVPQPGPNNNVREPVDDDEFELTEIEEWTASGKPDQPDGIDDDTHDLPSIESAGERVIAWVEVFGDGLCAVDAGRPLYSRDLAALAANVDTTNAVRSALRLVKQQLERVALENEELRAELFSLKGRLDEE